MKPGDLLFIPSGWWHTALNLEESIAVTQNVVSSQNLSRVMNFLRSKKHQELYQAFQSGMKEHFPEALAKVGEEITKPKKQLFGSN